MNRQATQEPSQDGTGYGEGEGRDEGQEEVAGLMVSWCFVHSGKESSEGLACVYLLYVVAFCGVEDIQSDFPAMG